MSKGEETLAFQLKAVQIPHRRQVRVTDERDWTVDFLIAGGATSWYVEVEGGAWTGGHRRGAQADLDYEKFNWMAMAGMGVLRFSTAMVEDGRALTMIEKAIGR